MSRPAALAAVFSLVHGQPNYGGCNIFPANMNWNVKVNTLPVHSQNAQFASLLGTTKLHLDFGTTTDQTSQQYYGIPWNQVAGSGSWTPITFDPAGSYHDESDCATGDNAPYVLNSPCGECDVDALVNVKLPIPTTAQVENGISAGFDSDDHHLLLVDTTACVLWEVYQTYKNVSLGWYTTGAISRWDMKTGALRPRNWTSSDAAGLPVMPLLVREDEATGPGTIGHAFRFTLPSGNIRSGKGTYEWPASHNTGGGGSNTPLMGQRFRLKASFTIPSSWSAQSQSIATALKEYGIILADIGSSMYIQGEPNAGWDMDNLIAQIQSIGADKFEAVDISSWKSASGFNILSGLVPGATGTPNNHTNSVAPSAAPNAGGTNTPSAAPHGAGTNTPSAAPHGTGTLAPSTASNANGTHTLAPSPGPNTLSENGVGQLSATVALGVFLISLLL